MTWRGLVVAAALAVVGAAAGVGIAEVTDERPVELDTTTTPVAASPSIPTTPPVEVFPDPSTPALGTDLPTHRETVGQDPFALELPVPDGWARSNSRPRVRRLHVAVQHPVVVECLEPQPDLPDHLERLADRQPRDLEPVGERPLVGVRHHQVGAPVVELARVVDRDPSRSEAGPSASPRRRLASPA